MRTFLICSCLLVLFVAAACGKQLPRKKRDSTDLAVHERARRDLGGVRPQNLAVLVSNPSFTLECSSDGSPGSRITWYEYTYTPNGGIVSENNQVSPNSPLAPRARIISSQPNEYFLQISPILISDGGMYECREGANNLDWWFMQLTVIATTQAGWNCSTTIRASGTVLEGDYVTNECLADFKGGLVPNFTWSGMFDFTQGYVATETALWAGMHFNATRSMQTQVNRLTLNFTNYWGTMPGLAADNVPTYSDIYQGPQMYIYWGPKGIAVDPIKDYYVVGDRLTCNSDANPTASHAYQNLRTLEIFTGQVLVIPASWQGYNQTVRCQAVNTIEGIQYTTNVFVVVYVPTPTSPPTTIPTTTTTPPPAVSPCNDLTGQWVATDPGLVTLCIILDLNNNAFLTGNMKNGTQTFNLDIVGRSQIGNFGQVGFSGIWPGNMGMTTAVGECHRCFGTEVLIVNYVSRQKGSPCGVPGPVQYSGEYRFSRVGPSVACPNLPAVPAPSM